MNLTIFDYDCDISEYMSLTVNDTLFNHFLLHLLAMKKHIITT